MKLLTWNVHGFVGQDGKADPQRIASAIAHFDPDIAVLQEVDCRALNESPIDLLRRATDICAVDAPAMGTGTAWYGQALFSRLPLVRHEVHDLSVSDREPRRLLEVVLAAPEGELRILAAHLGLKRYERRQQMRRIAEVARAGGDIPTVLAGDLNEWLPARGMSKRLLGPDSASTPPDLRTFPARFPMFPLDRIMTAPARMLQNYDVDRSFKQASDHLPLTASLTLA